MNLSDEKIKLRPLQITDLSNFLAYRSDPEVARYQGFDPFDEATALTFLQKNNWVDFSRKQEWMQIGIIDQQTDQVIGDCALHLHGHEGLLAELGCTINRSSQGKGMAKAAMKLLINTLINQKLVHKFTATIDTRNKAAIHLIESLGFQKEGIFIAHYFDKIDQAWTDECTYGLLAKTF